MVVVVVVAKRVLVSKNISHSVVVMRFSEIAVKRSSTGWQQNPKGKWRQIWLDISKGFVYLSYASFGRTYWVLSKMKPSQRPRIRANDRTQTIWINTYGIRFTRKSHYNYAKEHLLPYTRTHVRRSR